MQAQSQIHYKVAIWERSANPAVNVRSWGQLAEILPAVGVGEKGWRASRPVPALGKSGRLLGWVAGRVAARLARGSRCTTVQTRARQNTCVLPPSSLLDGRTHRWLQSSRGQCTALCSLWSRTKITTGDSGAAGECASFLKLGWGILQFHRTPTALLWWQAKRQKAWRGITENCITKHQHTPHISPLFSYFFLLCQQVRGISTID